MKENYISIVMTHYSDSKFRSDLMEESLESLIASVKYLPVEIIVVNNGTKNAHEYFSKLAEKNKITTYIYNSSNLHFGFARNQGISMARGNYLCIVDDDLIYRKGWLDECLWVLEDFPDKKIYATPVDYPTPVMKQKYDQGWLEKGGRVYQLNMRAGSNCFVIRREDFDVIGNFKAHRIAGSIWTDHAVRAGYLAAIIPGQMVEDRGLRRGYNLSESIPIIRTLLNGKEIVFNTDEYQLSRK